jgi:ParB family chromosome partitioning protein
MDKTRRFLDPIIVVRRDAAGSGALNEAPSNDDASDGADGARYLTPNGNHRLTVLKELGAKAIIGLLVPETKVAYQILALNIEKAHNLRERALEVVRMCRDLETFTNDKETDFDLEFEEPSLVTLGFAYEERGRLSGSAYHPVLKKVDSWIDKPLVEAVEERERRAQLVLALDDAVGGAVKRLKEAGLTSPYLKAFVVARINPLRFMKGDLPTMDELLAKMTKKAEAMDASKIKATDVSRSGGAPS